MILGMSMSSFTLLHVLISLIGIAAGITALRGLWHANRLPGWTAVFLATTVATSGTGFMFHSVSFGPPHVVGVISLLVLTVAILALYGRRLTGPWRWIYVVCAVLALYLNVFVGVVQAFHKVSFLHPLVPTGSEPPFVATQGLVLAAFIALGAVAAKRFHPAAPPPARR